jgi:Cohesin domain
MSGINASPIIFEVNIMKGKSLIIILALLLLIMPVSAAVMNVQVEGKTANPGSRVIIPVKVSGAANLGGMDLIVLYNSSVLKYIKTEKGSLSSNAIIEANQSHPGLILISIVDSGGISGTGSICQLSFDVTGKSGSSSYVALDVQGAYNTDLRDVVTNTTSDMVTVSGNKSLLPLSPLVAIAGILICYYIVFRQKRRDG